MPKLLIYNLDISRVAALALRLDVLFVSFTEEFLIYKSPTHDYTSH